MFERRRSRSAVTAATRAAWPLTGALFGVVLASSIALAGLIAGTGWWWALVLTGALLLVLPAVLRMFGVRRWVASVIDVLVFVAVIDACFGGGHALLGVIPTPGSSAEVFAQFRRALLAIQDQGIPARPLPELIFFIVLFGGVFALVLDLVAIVLRLPALVALVMLAVLVVPAVLQPSGSSLWALAAAAVAYLLVLAADGRVRLGRRGGGAAAVAVGAAATVIALIVTATAPGFDPFGRVPQGDGPVQIGTAVNPLVDLSRDLHQPNAVPVLQYHSSSSHPVYLQMTTLDTFTGATWRHTDTATTPLRGGAVSSEVPGLGSGIAANSVRTSIQISSLTSNWVPAPYPVRRVAGIGGDFTVQGTDLTVAGGTGRLSRSDYTVTSLDVEPTPEQLAVSSATALPPQLQRDTYLPAQVPEIITDTANQVVADAGATSEFDKAVALQSYFQSNLNGFTYSTDTPDPGARDSLQVVASFLQSKEGYCVHFATAMAVMARTLGIPSRIAIGYLPGNAIGTQGDQTVYQVDSTDLHAWPQLYFPGIGWLAFEPTVSRGAVPAYTVPQIDPGTLPSSVPSASASASAPAQALPSEQAQQTADRAGEAVGAGANPWPWIALAAAVLLVLALPAAVRAARRRRRLRRLRRDGGPAQAAWVELRESARDLRFVVTGTQTPHAFAVELAEAAALDEAARADLDGLVAAMERAAYGPPGAFEPDAALAARLERVLAVLPAGRGRAVRNLAVFAPLSLVRPAGAGSGQSEHADFGA